MRLLHIDTWELREFFNDPPPYAILSHTWGPGQDELTFDDVRSVPGNGFAHITTKAGFAKAKGCCRVARQNGFDYVWIDTCCIDKSSSAELSEAINSMFLWYQQSSVCYAYLADVLNPGGLVHSRWFKRGWTLQELLAPNEVLFYDKDWALLGSKIDLRPSITTATGIAGDFLHGRALEEASVAQRMSWAANRGTSRREDTAYCLLGIFGVHMPMVYGEGHKAFNRLQEEIIKESRDLSLFAWIFKMPWSLTSSIFATSPREYLHCSNIQHVGWPRGYGSNEAHYFSSNRGLQIHLPVLGHRSSPTTFAILDCGIPGDHIIPNDRLLALPLPSKNKENTLLVRHKYSRPILVAKNTVKAAAFRDVVIEKQVPHDTAPATTSLDFGVLAAKGYSLHQVFPSQSICEIDILRHHVLLLPANSIMLVFRKDHQLLDGCFYLHIQGQVILDVRALLSPISVNDAYLFWRLSISDSLLHALEQEVLAEPDILVFFNFDLQTELQTVAQGYHQSTAEEKSSMSTSRNILRSILPLPFTRPRDPNIRPFASHRELAQPNTRGARNNVSWDLEFLEFNDHWSKLGSRGKDERLLARIGCKNRSNGSEWQLVSRERNDTFHRL